MAEIEEQFRMDQTVSLAELTADDFLPHVNSTFSLRLDDGKELPLTLTEVKQYDHPTRNRRQQFSLYFQGTPGLVLPQQIYPLSHAQMGVLEIFIVPIGRTSEGTEYEAVFA